VKHVPRKVALEGLLEVLYCRLLVRGKLCGRKALRMPCEVCSGSEDERAVEEGGIDGDGKASAGLHGGGRSTGSGNDFGDGHARVLCDGLLDGLSRERSGNGLLDDLRVGELSRVGEDG